ncbi:hypothetical protein VC83_02414 [Pseudogymnoascus destructans]|uniref:Uncharacterized protein n=2 Tax=Pseudogymnoascus destructans TaxID=655981 RepID=L8G204_PSED2|nr:uncharacterized protein VC83_02414 [Pseudogymnoascus destructans]ELR07127.1 hypothetical protein GMDG_02396 [Pseudogymnoascus destructans 20631-21]OAF60939.1 hypothetical protein VC83_02414 [Pseudogymnoascus destructans]
MAKSKRDSAFLDYDEPFKRPRHSGNAPPKEGTQGRIDPTYGQRSAFPGLDEDGGFGTEDNDLDYGDDAGAISYLRAVRSEAAGIPTVLVAPKPILAGGDEEDRAIYDDGVGDSRGFYSDGAYTAAPDPQPDAPADIPAAKHLRAKYFEKILERFEHLREQLGNTPPDDVVKKLDQNHDSYMSASAADYRKWRWRVINTEPMNAQLARMDRATSLRLLRLLTNDKLAMGGSTVPSERLSRWIWGVLARLPDSGELNSEEIGLVRDLGKRAVWLGVVINQPQSDTAAGMPGDEYNESAEDYDDEEEDGEVGNEFPIPEREENDAREKAVEYRTEVGAHKPRANAPAAPRDNIFRFDSPATESVTVHATLAKAVLEDSLPNPEIYNFFRFGYGDQLTEKQLGARECLRNFYRRNRGFARSNLLFYYQRNRLVEQYDGPLPPAKQAGGNWGYDFEDFLHQNPGYSQFLDFPNEDAPRNTAGVKFGDEAFDRAWQAAGLDTPQTRVYDNGQDEEEIAMAKLGLFAGRDPRPAIIEEPKPEVEGQEETLEVARGRILAQLGEAGDANAAELARARDALKEQELKERACEEEEDAARLLNAKATVDMIITVAGEIYRQRDLLEFRETWD